MVPHAWPSQGAARSLQPQLASPLVGYSYQGSGCAGVGRPLHLRGPELVAAAAVAVTAGQMAVAALVAAAAEVVAAAAAGTCSSC